MAVQATKAAEVGKWAETARPTIDRLDTGEPLSPEAMRQVARKIEALAERADTFEAAMYSIYVEANAAPRMASITHRQHWGLIIVLVLVSLMLGAMSIARMVG